MYNSIHFIVNLSCENGGEKVSSASCAPLCKMFLGRII